MFARSILLSTEQSRGQHRFWCKRWCFLFKVPVCVALTSDFSGCVCSLCFRSNLTVWQTLKHAICCPLVFFCFLSIFHLLFFNLHLFKPFDDIWCTTPHFLFHSCVTQTEYVSVHLSKVAICYLKCFTLFASCSHVRVYCCVSEMWDVFECCCSYIRWNREMVPWSAAIRR